jgi:hypothetical protein
MEYVLNPQQLDQGFDKTAQEQYTKDLFSSVFDIMIQVVSCSRPTVHATHQATKEGIGVAVASVCNKLARKVKLSAFRNHPRGPK